MKRKLPIDGAIHPARLIQFGMDQSIASVHLEVRRIEVRLVPDALPQRPFPDFNEIVRDSGSSSGEPAQELFGWIVSIVDSSAW